MIEYVLYCWMDEYGNIEPEYKSWMEEEDEGGWFPVYRKIYVGDVKDYGKDNKNESQ